jgi:renalase
VRLTLEIAVSTPEEAVAAVNAGADRLELASGLELGGLTPSLGLFTRVRELVSVPVWVLLRPRAGGFEYTRDEFEVVVRDAQSFLAAGADGLVFGALEPSGRVDEQPCRRLLDLAKGRIAFHRAFDFTPDPAEALKRLIALGCKRILTSGGARTALEGVTRIAEWINQSANRITVMPGGGIRPDTVADLVRETGCVEIHAAARSLQEDSRLSLNLALAPSMGADEKGRLSATNVDLVARLRRELDRLSSLP